MTTWTGNKANERRKDYLGKTVQITYSMTGVSGDTGGTLTCTGLKIIDDCVVSVFKSNAGVASTAYISGKTIVVAYSDPTAGHTIRITAWGLKN
jgi:hypothetical protein